jgi:hypothetical protein
MDELNVGQPTPTDCDNPWTIEFQTQRDDVERNLPRIGMGEFPRRRRSMLG